MRSATAAFVMAVTGLTVAGCGSGTASSPLRREDIPLVPGVHLVEQARQCDRGANAFCALELVVADPGFRSSGDLVTREGQVLHRFGWTKVPGDSGTESGANSPSQKLHLSYGTALADLIGSGAGWFKRSHAIALALSRELVAKVPAVALTLQTGPA